jgi:hypothetical protein
VLETLFIAALIVTITLFPTSRSQSAHAASSGPTIIPSQTVVHSGMTIKITARGFAANDQVALYFDDYSVYGHSFATLSCDTNGNCSGKVKLPFPGVQGIHILYGVGSQPNEIAQANIMFNPIVSPVEGGPGAIETISGSSFSANETVSAYWGTAKGISEGSATSDSYGNISFQVTAPTNVKPGNYPITIVRSQQLPSTVRTRFRILPPVMKLSKGGIRSGQAVTVSVSGFQAGEAVTISWDANGGQTVTTATVNDGGWGEYSIIPPVAAKGSYTVTAVGDSSGLKASHALNIGPGLVFNSDTDIGVNPGGSYTISGGGFSSNEALQVYFQKAANGSVSVTTDASGAFSTTLTAPKQYDSNATYYVYAVNVAGNEKAKVQIFFISPSVTITDTSGANEYLPYGAPVVISGQGFLSGEAVDLYWNYQLASQAKVATALAASDGTFSVTITAPSTPGSYTNDTYTNVAAIGETSQLQAVVSQLDVSTGMNMNPVQGPAGTVVTITGGNFAANNQITIVLFTGTVFPGGPGGNAPSPSDGTVPATTTTDGTGAFSVTFTMPALTTTDGSLLVYAEGEGRSFAVGGYTYQ